MSDPDNKKMKTLYETYENNGDLKTVVRLLDKDVDKSKCWIRRWAVYLSIAGCCLILGLLIAALAAVYFAPRNGLYLESCESRSCVKDLNLKCINKTCLCENGYIYIDKCILKKDYMEKCRSTSYCKDNKNMICIDGVCKCDDYKYWNGKTCVSRVTFGKVCTNDDQCLIKTFLYCDTVTKKCTCDNVTRFWDGNGCFPKRTLNENCKSTSECRDWENLKCLFGKCQCNSSQYWDFNIRFCHDKLRENDTCTATYQCYNPMNCTNLNMCQCNATQYHDFSTLTCIPKSTYSESCKVDFNCRVDKYLECKSGTCQCISSFPQWSIGYDSCILPHTYTENCFDTPDCDTTKLLTCNENIINNNNCTCPTQLTVGKCDCIREVYKEYYWNGLSCVTAIAYNGTCKNTASSYMCKTMTEGTICKGPYPYRCLCPTLQYYNYYNSKCENQLLEGISCIESDACRSDLGLNCQIGFCQCNTFIQYWNGTKCVNLLSYNQGACINDDQCKGNLICQTALSNSCNCPSAINPGYCDCPPRIPYSEYYWNGSQCTLAAPYNQSCNGADYSCQTLKEQTSCDPITKRCYCPNGAWNSTNCNYCATDWKYLRGSCFTGSNKNTLYQFDTLTSADIISLCYNEPTARIAILQNTDFLTNIFMSSAGYPGYSQNEYYMDAKKISSTTQFQSSDGSILTYDPSIWSNSNKDCVRLQPGNPPAIDTHDCNHKHEIICEYKLI